MAEKARKLSTDPYKGVRDFYPADMAVENRIYSIWREACERYGYQEYSASILEPAELYRAKSGEELINEQTYTFTDRGEREVTLRPEMTPTVARMIAGRRRELTMPVRWFSIPNLFRYEQPQRGRLREHWQLNVDIFGVDSIAADIEVIALAAEITRAYGLKDADFEIRLNNRLLMNYVTQEVFGLNGEAAHKIGKLIDRKQKISHELFEQGVAEVFLQSSKIQDPNNTKAPSSNVQTDTQKFLTLLNSKNFEEFTTHLPQTALEHKGLKDVKSAIDGLTALGVTNVRFDQTLMRGFDYYTGNVFEVFDLNPANKRSVFGGGRYDDLLSLFGNEKVAAFGFGAGDVVARDLMETYGTLANSIAPQADVAICILNQANTSFALKLAQELRQKGQRVFVDISGKKVGDQIANAGKRNIPEVIVIGDEEVKTGKYKIKNLQTGAES